MPVKTILTALFALLMLDSACAQFDGHAVYINGIQVTRAKASEQAKEMVRILNDSVNRTGSNKRTFVDDYVYNPIGFFGVEDGESDFRQDMKELFILKTAEELYHADFQRIIAPHNMQSNLDREAAIRIKEKYVDDLTPGVDTNSLEQNEEITDDDMDLTKKTLQGILSKLKVGGRVFVAHSQGNLLANLAWASFVAEIGPSAQNRAKIVNVANTSRFSVSGLNLTHDRDTILFSSGGLVGLPSQGRNWTRTTPDCLDDAACNFALAPATFSGRASAGDTFEHYFLDTYLSTIDLPNAEVQQGVTYTSGRTQFRDRFEDLVYAAAVSLDVGGQPAAARYVSFVDGDPGVPGDGIRIARSPFTVSSSPYRLSSAVRFQDAPNGLTISTFSGIGVPTPELLVVRVDNGLPLSDPCYRRFGSNIGAYSVVERGGVIGLVSVIYPSYFEYWAEFLNQSQAQFPGCAPITPAALVLVELWPQTLVPQPPNSDPIVSFLDAAAIGFGVGILP
jgi:hypothetical protein